MKLQRRTAHAGLIRCLGTPSYSVSLNDIAFNRVGHRPALLTCRGAIARPAGHAVKRLIQETSSISEQDPRLYDFRENNFFDFSNMTLYLIPCIIFFSSGESISSPTPIPQPQIPMV